MPAMETTDKRWKDGGGRKGEVRKEQVYGTESEPGSLGQSLRDSETKHGIFQRMLACLPPSRPCPAAWEHLPMFPTWQPPKTQNNDGFSLAVIMLSSSSEIHFVFFIESKACCFLQKKSYHVLYSFKNNWSGPLVKVEQSWWERKEGLLESHCLSELKNICIFWKLFTYDIGTYMSPNISSLTGS